MSALSNNRNSLFNVSGFITRGSEFQRASELEGQSAAVWHHIRARLSNIHTTLESESPKGGGESYDFGANGATYAGEKTHTGILKSADDEIYKDTMGAFVAEAHSIIGEAYDSLAQEKTVTPELVVESSRRFGLQG